MSKNLTRKGLALGAVVALGSSLFAGAPAFAAPALQVAPSTGTGYTVLASDAFTLKVVGNVDYTMSSASDLYWKITQPSATASVVYSGTIASGTPTAASTSTVKIIDATATATTTANTLTITPTIGSSDASQAYAVQAYIESGLTAGFDANDVVVSSSVTVNFVKGSELTSVATVDQVAAGLAVTGTVKYTNTDFNYAQSTLDNTHALVNLDGSTYADGGAVTLNDDKNGFEFSTTAKTVAAGSVIGIKSRVTGYNSDATYTNSAVVYSTASAANDATAMEETITVGDNILKNGSGDYYVRTGTKSFSYRVDFTKASGVQAVAAGKPVRITVTEDSTSVATNDVIRVNGKKLTGTGASAQSAVLNTVTDAAGGVTVTVESDLGLVSDKISIAVVPTGGTGTSTNAFTWTDAALTTLSRTNDQLVADKETVLKGASVSLKYAIRDQFGKVWTKSGTSYRVKAVASGGSLVLTTTADFANGEATVTFTDNSTSAGTPDITATVWEKTTGDYSQNTAITNTSDQVVSNLNVVTTAQAAASITTNAATKGDGNGTVSSSTGTASDVVDRADATLSAIDLRSNANGAGLGVTSSKSAKFTGSVKNADGSPSQGATVTIAGAGLFFSTSNTGSTYVSSGSITVNATVAGTYEVYAFSKKGGSVAVTITSGSVVKTQNVKFAAAAAADGKTLTITAPANSLPGRAVDVVVLLVDKYGAPVTTATASPISVTLTGVGYATTIATNTDADGKITFKLILGANEVGTATITAKYDADDTATNYAAITTVATVNVSNTLPAAAATAAVSGSTGKFFVSATAAAGKSVVVKVAGKFVTSFKATGSKKSVAVKATKGSKKVTVFVGGKLVATKTVTVK